MAENKIKAFFRDEDSWAWLLAAAVMLAAFLPYLLLGQHAFIKTQDNLECEFVNLVELARSGKSYDFSLHSSLDRIMNGLPRAALRSGINVSVVLFNLFPPFTAYLINQILVELIAFVGMFLLLKTHILSERKERYIVILLSASFAVLRYFWVGYGISVAGDPFILYAFLNILNYKGKWTDYLIIACFPLYSSIVMIAPFMTVVLVLIGINRFYISKRININYILSIALFLLVFLIVEFQMINALFISRLFTTHRVEFGSVNLPWPSFRSIVHDTYIYIIEGNYWGASTKYTIIILCTILTIIISFFNEKLPKVYYTLLVAILLICSFAALYPTLIYPFFLKKIFPGIVILQLTRFYLLLTLFWFLVFALSIKYLSKYISKNILILFMIGELLLALGNFEYRENLKILFHKPNSESISYQNFFDEKTFSAVKDFIHQPQSSYRVVSMGLHPSIALYNGFYCIDAYEQNYPLEYKHDFRKIIAHELAKDTALRNYYQLYGGRCYFYSGELGLGYDLSLRSDRVIHQLDVDTTQLKHMGCNYVLSAVPILNHDAEKLVFLKDFQRPDGYWHIYLYKLQ